MADRIKGITVEIGGETGGLNKALKDVNSTSRNLQTELRDVERLLKFDPTNVEALAQKQKLLNEQIDNTSEKLNRLRQVEQQVEEQFKIGDISEKQFRAFRREIEFTERNLKNLKGSFEDINKADVSTARRSLGKLKDAAREVKGEIDTISTGFAGLGGAAVAGVGGLVGGMQDYNEVLARLRTNASMAGRDLGTVETAFGKIVPITGEADAAGETLANLLASGFSDEQLSEVIDNVNGAYIKFSDTLKTEGIADGIQETFATGKAVGPFAELLERSGISLEDFDKKLGATGTDAERANLILQTLKDQGFADITEKYKEMNPEVQRSAEANASLQKSLSELAIIFAPIVAAVTEFLTKIITWMEKNPELTKTIVAIVAVLGILIALGMAFAPVLALITGLAGAFSMAILPMAAIVLGIVIAIVALIAAGIWLYKNWDVVKAKAKELVDKIKEKFDEFKKIDLKKIGKDVIQGLIDGIAEMKDKVMKKAKEIAESVGKTIKSALKIGSPSKLTMELGEFTGEGLVEGLQNSMSQIKAMSTKMAVAAVPRINREQPQAGAAANKALTVNIHSPKALDVREANKEFNRTFNKMSLMW